MAEGRQDSTGHPSTERVSVPQAADHLGTTVDAIRKRVQRGTIPYEKDTGGRVWILLDTGRPRQDNNQDTTGRRQDAHQDLIDELRDRVRFLEGELERRGEEATRYQEIVARLSVANAQLSARIPELEAPAHDAAADPKAAPKTPTDNQPVEAPQTGQPPVKPRSSGIVVSLVPLPRYYYRFYEGTIGRDERRNIWGWWIRVAPKYFLGALLTALAAFADAITAPTSSLAGGVGALVTLRLIVAVAFGFYVGMKEADENTWGRTILLGVLTGVLTAAAIALTTRIENEAEAWVNLGLTYVVGTLAMFISGVLLGIAIQFAAERERWAQPESGAAPGQQRAAAGGLSVRATTILGLIGVLGSALLQSAGQIVAATLGN